MPNRNARDEANFRDSGGRSARRADDGTERHAGGDADRTAGGDARRLVGGDSERRSEGRAKRRADGETGAMRNDEGGAGATRDDARATGEAQLADAAPGHRPSSGSSGVTPDGKVAGARNKSSVTRLSPGAAPSRQLRRVGVKIGQKVLEFQRPVFRLGPLHVYRSASGRLRVRWRPD